MASEANDMPQTRLNQAVSGGLELSANDRKAPEDQGHNAHIVVAVQGYWWMVGTFVFALAFILATFGWVNAERNRANDVKTAIVKMVPTGETYVEFHDEDAPVDVWPAVINAKLEKAFTRRYKVDPRTVRNDMTYFSHFLDRLQMGHFMDSDGFDVLSHIKAVEAGEKGELVYPELTSLHHVDGEYINVAEMTGDELITSQLTFEFAYYNPVSGERTRLDRPADVKIVVVQWRINPVKLKRRNYDSQEEFELALYENPIALEVLSYKLSDVKETN